MVTASISVAENAIINSLVKKLQNIFMTRILRPLRGLAYGEIVGYVNNNLNSIIDEMDQVIEDHIRSILKLEVFSEIEGLNQMEETQLQNMLVRFMSNSRYKISLENFKVKLQQNIEQLVSQYRTGQIDREYFNAVLTEEVEDYFHNMRRIAVTEGLTAINQARAIYYEMEDEFNEYTYYWSIYRDNRTTVQCKEIVRRVDIQGGSVSLDELKRIIKEVALEYDPNYPYREFNPHYNCRSRLMRQTR